MSPLSPAPRSAAAPAEPSSAGEDGRGRTIRARGAAAVVAVVLLLGPLLVVDAARAEPASACAGAGTIAMAERSAEDRLLDRLNSLRRGRGLQPLVLNSAMSYEASQWSMEMARQNRLMHDSSLLGGLLDLVNNLLRVAENVGRATASLGCTSAQLLSSVTSAVDTIHGGFVSSPSHNRNMVGAYNQVGIGVHVDGNRVWVTLRFANGSLPAAATEASRRYVDALHQLFLGRKASPAEVNRWAATVQGGGRDVVTRSLAVSNEWAGVRIADLYRGILGRNADAAGRQYWLSQVASGLLLEGVAAGFYASNEYFGRSGGTNRGFVSGLYRDILGRNADAAGLNHWVTMMSRGMSRYEVASNFYASIESRRDRVSTLYREILNRGPDAGGLAYWANQLLTVGDIGLASYLAASPEYYNRSVR